MDLKKKEIEAVVKSKGLNFNDWKNEVIRHGRMVIIDREGDEYRQWEHKLLEQKAFELMKHDIIDTMPMEKKQEDNKNDFQKLNRIEEK